MPEDDVSAHTGTSPDDTDLFKVLRKRHACRDFEPEPIPAQILEKLAYAAHRAPTGGNAPYRFIVIVNDPVQLNMLKLVSPGYFGDSSAAIVVCTDMRTAERGLGKLGIDQCALYDAGAAAENIVLAAYALGLGGSFIKSYSENAVKKILHMPDECRTELIVSLGYPARNEPKPLKKRTGAKKTYLNTHGEHWKPARKSDMSPAQVEPRKERTTPEQQIFELALFLLTAARGCVTEPRIYGPLRLVDAVSRLADLYSRTDLLKPDGFLLEAKKKIEENEDKVMVSEEEFVKFIDEMINQFTDELLKRYGRAQSTS